MANKLFYTYIHGTDYKNDSFVPDKMIYSYWDSLIFDVNHRTIWHQGMPFGNVYPGTLSYGEIALLLNQIILMQKDTKRL